MVHQSDTSVWVDYLNGVDSPACRVLQEWLDEDSLAVGDLVAMEVLQGLRRERVEFVESIFHGCGVVSMVSPALALAAAANYRTLRRRGRTVRSTIDCLIATYCIENDIELLHSDRDLDPFEEHLGLRVIHA